MNDLVRFATSVEYTTGKKRGRHPVFNSNMFYPYKEERRLQQATKNELESFLGAAFGAAVAGENFVSDSLDDLSNLPEELSEDMKREISYAADSIARKASQNIVNMTEMVVGKPYYPPSAKQEIIENWQSNFAMLCKSAESDVKKDISMLVQQARNEGWNLKQLEREVKDRLPSKYAGRAQNIARTETAKLETSVTLSTYREIGVEYYVWMSAMDERTRPEHAMMNGRICSVNDPTVWYEENPDDPMHPILHKRDDTMVHLHPGEDFQCRCVMVPWDPMIDGKYEVKERPEEEKPEEKPENEPESRELEKANERLAEKEKELETTKAELKSANKEIAAANHKTKILQNASSRHSARVQSEIEEIRQSWLNNRAGKIKPVYTDVLSDDLTKMTPTDVQDVSGISNMIGQLAKKEKSLFSRGFVGVEAVSQSKTYASTDIAGKIYINFATDPNGFNAGVNLVSAFAKLKAGVALSETEEYAIEVLWHEILHNMSKNKTVLPELNDLEFGHKRMLMETVNQLVARHTYGRLLSKFGGKSRHNDWVLSHGFGYHDTVDNLRKLLNVAKIDEKKFVELVEKDLMQDYRFFEQNLKNTLVKLYKGKGDISFVVDFLENNDFELFVKLWNI